MATNWDESDTGTARRSSNSSWKQPVVFYVGLLHKHNTVTFANDSNVNSRETMQKIWMSDESTTDNANLDPSHNTAKHHLIYQYLTQQYNTFMI